MSQPDPFALPTSTADLPEMNVNMSRMQYDQQAPTRDVTGANFPNGAIHTRFQVSGTRRWNPSKSYIRMRCSLTKSDSSTPLNTSDDIGCNMGLMSNLFQSGEFRIADKTVSRVSDYMAQVDALDTRLSKSKAWLDSTGKSTNMWESSFEERKHKVSSNGVDYKKGEVSEITSATIIDAGRAQATNTVQWDLTGNAAGERLLIFAEGGTPIVAPNTNFNCQVELKVGDTIVFGAGTLAAQALVVINVINATTVQIALPGEGTVDSTVAIGTNVFSIYRASPHAPSRRVKTFELAWQPPMSIFKVQEWLPAGKYELVLNPQTTSTYKQRAIESLVAKTAGTDFEFAVIDMYLYTAMADSSRIDDLTYMIDLDETRCQVDTGTGSGLQQKNFDVSPSSYALSAAFQDASAGSTSEYSASKFKVRAGIAGGNDLSLTRLYLTYGGQSKPSPDADPSYVEGTAIDYTTQRYADSLLQSGQFFQDGGSETIQEWQVRGPYYHFNWPKDGRDRSTRAQVNFQLGTPANTRVLMFDHYKSVANISVKDGHVIDVQVFDA